MSQLTAFIQGTAMNIHIMTTELRQVFAWLSHHLIQMWAFFPCHQPPDFYAILVCCQEDWKHPRVLPSLTWMISRGRLWLLSVDGHHVTPLAILWSPILGDVMHISETKLSIQNTALSCSGKLLRFQGTLLLCTSLRFVFLKRLWLQKFWLYHQVELENGEVIVLASASTTIWPKADIVPRDYVKRVR